MGQLGEDHQFLTPPMMATCLQFSYANLSLLFARFHAKIIPWGHDSRDFVQLGFSGGEEEDGYDEEDAAFLGH